MNWVGYRNEQDTGMNRSVGVVGFEVCEWRDDRFSIIPDS